MDCSFLYEIEKKYNLYNANIDGYFYWIYFRNDLFWDIQKKVDKLYSTSSGNNEKTKYRRLRNIVNYWKCLKRNISMKTNSCEMLVINHPRRVLIDGYYDCVYTEDLLTRFKSYVVIEEAYRGEHHKEIRTQNIIYSDIIDLYSYILCSFSALFQSKANERIRRIFTDEVSIPIRELCEHYHVNIDVDNYVQEIIFGYYMYKAERFFYSKKIDKYKPKVIIEVVSYNRRCMVVNEIAHERGTPTIELQHGSIGNDHFAYNFYTDSLIRQFPKYFFAFGDFWKKGVFFPINEKRVISVGYPYLEKMYYKYKRDREDSAKQTVLFLSPGTLGDRLSVIAEELSNNLDSDCYQIVYKLHPIEYKDWRENCPSLCKENITVIDNFDINLYDLLANCDYIVSGGRTTTIYEALIFGVPIYILDYCDSEYTSQLCNEYGTELFTSSFELQHKIINSHVKKNLVDLETIWKSNALDNMENVIRDMIRKE